MLLQGEFIFKVTLNYQLFRIVVIKIFLFFVYFVSRFLTKTLRVNKIAMKSFSKNLLFGVDFKL